MTDTIIATQPVTLLDALDTVLTKGVVVAGDATISVAGVDLIFLGLRALASSVETAGILRQGHNGNGAEDMRSRGSGGNGGMGSVAKPCGSSTSASLNPKRAEGGKGSPAGLNGLALDPENVEQGLAKLVLTLIELLRQLLERQAIRRVDGGSLTGEEIERMGETFLRLEQRMKELRDYFGLTAEDLNMNLGPLGDLM